jgi:hypothetical protein
VGRCGSEMEVAVATNSAIEGDYGEKRVRKVSPIIFTSEKEARLTTVASCLGPAAFLIRPIVTAERE